MDVTEIPEETGRELLIPEVKLKSCRAILHGVWIRWKLGLGYGSLLSLSNCFNLR